MRQLSLVTIKKIKDMDDVLVDNAKELVENFKKEDRQLRLIKNMAESSRSWKAVALFIRYQAARKQIDETWAKDAIKKLESLEIKAKSLAGESASMASPKRDSTDEIFMELASRVLGYAVRWHVWNTKGQGE
jgi:hypothetical protein